MKLEGFSLVMVVGLLSTAVVVLGQRQCSVQEKCTAIGDCGQFKTYLKDPYRTWPESVQKEAVAQYCGKEQKVWKVCCKASGRELLDMEKCGKSSQDRIANGKVAQVFEFPWMALLLDINGVIKCGGSLIAESYVLTAAHCRGGQITTVRLGETDLSTAKDCKVYPNGEEDCADPPQEIPVKRFIRHPRYSVSQKKNDIALIVLERPAQRNHNVLPICLPLPEVTKRIKTLPSDMLVSGWGFTELKQETSEQLRYASLPIMDLYQCNSSLSRLGIVQRVDDSQVCAGGGEDKADNCKGDSGGPLQYYAKNQFVIHGVVTFGQASCGVEEEPGVYAKVSHYLNWILDQMK